MTSAEQRAASADLVASAAQLACLLEVAAPKPGNVSPARAFHDTRYEDYLASAAAIGPAMLGAGERPLGATIRRAVEDTARWTRANTNLGIVLLLAPLARAARVASGDTLRERLRRVLAETTVDDAVDAYAAIRLAAPGGLGRADAEDVAAAPTVTLLQAMALAAARDAIAREYASGFASTFDVGAPALARARADGLAWPDAVVECYLTLLADTPDTHVARKLGAREAEAISARAREVLAAGGVRDAAGRRAIAAFDAAISDERNARNPGTTADLTAAATFVVLLDGGWR
jgi:triphosphoribosyl-dephospho-CoA synthase